jgi:hypothetical protein
LDHLPIIGFVDMIPGEHQDDFGIILLDGVDILEDRIGRPFIPAVADSPLGGERNDEAPAFGVINVPAMEDMTFERQGLVLGEKSDPPQSRIQAVG